MYVLFSVALQLAAAEFMLLGSTICILHSRGSSFAREAAAAMMIPVIDVCLCVYFVCNLLIGFTVPLVINI